MKHDVAPVRVVVLVVVITAALLLLTSLALGADPAATPSVTAAPRLLLEGGDLRSEGEGPGLVGNPLLILGAVVLLGLATALATALLVRLAQRD